MLTLWDLDALWIQENNNILIQIHNAHLPLLVSCSLVGPKTSSLK